MLGANFMKSVLKGYTVLANELAVEMTCAELYNPNLTIVALIGYKLLACSTALLLNLQRVCGHRDVMQKYLQFRM